MTNIFVGASSKEIKNDYLKICQTKNELLKQKKDPEENEFFFICEYKNVDYIKLIEKIEPLKIKENYYNISLSQLEKKLNFFTNEEMVEEKRFNSKFVLFTLGISEKKKLILKFFKYFPEYITYDFIECLKSVQKHKMKYIPDFFYFSEKGFLIFSILVKKYDLINCLVNSEIKINNYDWYKIKKNIIKF